MTLALLITLLALVSVGREASAQVVLTEVMSDPAGSEHHDEFVELINTSPTQTVNLSGWKLGDGARLDRLQAVDQALEVDPGQRVLVVDGSYHDASTTYDSVRGSARFITIESRAFGRAGWSNSQHQSVFLVDAQGDTVDHMAYEPASGQPGHSWERRRSDGTWQPSLRSGGTPGRPNSVDEIAAAPGRIELGISTDPVSRGVEIRCRLPAAPALLSVRLYDAEGNLIVALRDWVPAGLEELVPWDGRDRHGVATPPGMYVVSVRASAAGQIVQARATVTRW